MALTDLSAIHMKRESVTQMIELVNWYAAAPKFAEFGDRFHENVSDLMHEALPEDFDEKFGDDILFQRYDVVGGELKIVISDENANNEQMLDVIATD